MLRQLIHSEEIHIRNKPRSMNQHRSCSLCLGRDVCRGISDPRRQKKVDYNVCVASVSELDNTSTEQGQFLPRSTQASGKTLKLFQNES